MHVKNLRNAKAHTSCLWPCKGHISRIWLKSPPKPSTRSFVACALCEDLLLRHCRQFARMYRSSVWGTSVNLCICAICLISFLMRVCSLIMTRYLAHQGNLVIFMYFIVLEEVNIPLSAGATESSNGASSLDIMGYLGHYFSSCTQWLVSQTE